MRKRCTGKTKYLPVVTIQRAYSKKYTVPWFILKLVFSFHIKVPLVHQVCTIFFEAFVACSATPSATRHYGVNIPKKIKCDLHWEEGEWTASSLRWVCWSCKAPSRCRTVYYTSNHLFPKLPVTSTQDIRALRPSEEDNLSNNHGFGLYSAHVSVHTKAGKYYILQKLSLHLCGCMTH